jgi:hypothetical protein
MHAEDQDKLVRDLSPNDDWQRILKALFHKADKEGKLFRLLPDESAMLIAYREWKASRSSDNGVFEWRGDATKR